MLNNNYMAYAMIAIGIFTFYMAALNLFRSGRGNPRIAASAAPVTFTEEIAEADNGEAPALVKFCEKFLPKDKNTAATQKEQKDLKLELARAGIDSPYAVIYYRAFQVFVQPISLLAGVAYGYVTLPNTEGLMNIMVVSAISLILIITGLKGAKLYITNRRQKREQVLLQSFAEVMDLLLVCIESGLGLDAALNRVCRELRDMHPVAVSELDRTRLELTMLGDRVAALQNLANRANIPPFKTLVSALIQTEKFGTSLVDTLRVLSEEQRITRLSQVEQKAARLPVLITVPLILFIMPAFIMIILGPPIVDTINSGSMSAFGR